MSEKHTGDVSADGNRIPAERGRSFSSWQLPDIGGDAPIETALGSAAQSGRSVTARELEEISNNAYREGFDQGYGDGHREGLAAGREAGVAEGLAQAAAQIERQVAQLQQVMAQLMEPIATQQADLERALIRLVLDVARAVLAHEPALEPERLLPVVRTALQQLPVGERNFSVVLHPEQAALVQNWSQWPSHWRIESDVRVEPGGCRVVAEHTLVDYTIGLRFRQVAEQLLAERDSGEPPEPGLLLERTDDDLPR
jgi:flagellar assembly protein FliH